MTKLSPTQARALAAAKKKGGLYLSGPQVCCNRVWYPLHHQFGDGVFSEATVRSLINRDLLLVTEGTPDHPWEVKAKQTIDGDLVREFLRLKYQEDPLDLFWSADHVNGPRWVARYPSTMTYDPNGAKSVNIFHECIVTDGRVEEV